MSELTVEQQEDIKKYIEEFKGFLKTSKGLEWEQDRKNRTEIRDWCCRVYSSDKREC